ncbi:sugar ABC transporter substrate-binding protein [Pseudonocardia sp. K10HN5]|uniref:Sugar ABC transporter substrate-binding protein n=1 Tax=Pseudonocardia acidicola TaxID=2724939 RepID=A0ABX1SJW3_9PSEU|nr:sugar ABC transporter substrate-binding protein [Pseudonocardia acidicola]
MAHGLHNRLEAHEIELRVIFADFRKPGWPGTANDAFRVGVSAGVDAVVVWLVTPGEPAEGVAEARSQGIPVITLERPRFSVDASVVWPNFNHGVYMAQHLATLLDPGARVAVIGGPEVVDDTELVLGLVHGVTGAGLQLVNDPWLPQYRNITDVATGGKEAALSVLNDYPGLDGLIPFNDETMLGTVEALRKVGRLGEPKMVSRNGSPWAVQAVLDGVTHGTWDIEPLRIGEMLADLVIRQLVHGRNLDGLCQSSPIGRMITPELAKSWVPWNERGAWGPLHEGL